MTKKDIVRTIAEQIDLPQLRTKDLVQRTFDALIDALVQEGRIELRNFGVFQIKRREARMARNPRTGERVPVQAKSVVTFKPGKEMEARVRELDRSVSGGNTIANNHSVYEEMDDSSEDVDAGETE